MKKLTLGTVLNALMISSELKDFNCKLVHSSGEVLESSNLDSFKSAVIGSGEYFLKIEDWVISLDNRLICFFV